MPKGDISWKRQAETGERIEINARQIGDRWIFHARERRHEQWQEVENPPLEDWIELLDAVCRRIDRQLLKPEEAERLKKTIAERFPAQ